MCQKWGMDKTVLFYSWIGQLYAFFGEAWYSGTARWSRLDTMH